MRSSSQCPELCIQFHKILLSPSLANGRVLTLAKYFKTWVVFPLKLALLQIFFSEKPVVMIIIP